MQAVDGQGVWARSDLAGLFAEARFYLGSDPGSNPCFRADYASVYLRPDDWRSGTQDLSRTAAFCGYGNQGERVVGSDGTVGV